MAERYNSENGNVFFTLFAATALIGVIGAATATLMRGPVGTMVALNNKARLDSQEQIAGKLAVLEAAHQANNGDCDADSFVEPIAPDTSCTVHPAGGGCIPASIGAAKADPWGTAYGYCAWDHGAVTNSGCSGALLQGTNADNQPVIAIISAGPDRTFQAGCAADPAYVTKPAGSDDTVLAFTYAEAVQATGGLWTLKSGAPGTATIDKGIEVSGSARFQSAASFQGSGTFSGGGYDFRSASGLYLPDQTSSGACQPSNAGGLRTDGSAGQLLQICDPLAPAGPHNHAGWVDVGGTLAGTGVAGADGDVQFNKAGVFGADAGLVWDQAAGKLVVAKQDVTGDETVGGTLAVTGQAAAGSLNVTGNGEIHGALGVDGKLTTATDAAIGGALSVTGSAEIGGNTTADGTLAVTGLSTLTGGALVSQGTPAAPGLAFIGASNTGIYYTSGGVGLAAAGIGHAAVTSSGLAVTGQAAATGNVTAGGGMAATSFEIGSIGSGAGLFGDGSGGLALRTGGTTRLQLDAAGQVGIKLATAPTADLDLNGILRLRQTGATAGSPCGPIGGALSYVSGDQLVVCSDLTGKWETIGTSGGGGGGGGGFWSKLPDNRLYYSVANVGIGTADPLDRLHVNGGLLVTGATGSPAAPVSGAGVRLFFDPASGAFRAGSVNGSQWDTAALGAASAAFGSNTTASGSNAFAQGSGVTAAGANSAAFGSNVQVTGTGSVGYGLGSGTPTVSGASSYGVFLGAQGSANLSQPDTFGIFGGSLVVDPNQPATMLSANGSLAAAINGSLGALNYCDELGDNCFTADSVASLTGGTLPAPGADRQVIFNSGGALSASPGLTFSSTGLLAVGTAVRAGSGSAAAPAYGFSASAGTGLYASAANTAAIAAGGTPVMQFNPLGGAVNYIAATPGTAAVAPKIANAGSSTNGVGLGLAFTARNSSNGNGGNIDIQAGDTTADFGLAGKISLVAGGQNAPGSANSPIGGSANLVGGSITNAAFSAMAGGAFLTGGNATTSAGAALAGAVALSGGTGTGTVAGTGGDVLLSGGTGSSAGGNIRLWGGIGPSRGKIYLLSPTVGVQTSTPVVALDVNGTLRIAYGGETCDGTTLGGLYFSSATHMLYGCLTPGSWTPISTAATAGAAAGSDTQIQFNSGGVLSASPALTFNSTGVLNTAKRIVAGGSGLDSYSTFITGGNDTSTGAYNTAVGYGALSANTVGRNNTAIGADALQANTTGQWNTAIGQGALEDNTTASYNLAIGFSALSQNALGTHNTIIGNQALSNNISGGNNTAIGDSVGNSITTGSRNILIGADYTVKTPAADTSNFLDIGNTIFATGTSAGTLAAPTGNVGIDTTTPATALDVNGTIRMGYGGESCTASTVGGLYFSSATHQIYGCLTPGPWTQLATGSGPGAAAGSDTQIQFNSGGALYARSDFTFSSSGTLTVNGSLSVTNVPTDEDGDYSDAITATATGGGSAGNFFSDADGGTTLAVTTSGFQGTAGYFNTSNDNATVIMAEADGNNNMAIYGWTGGTNSQAVYAWATGANSQAVYARSFYPTGYGIYSASGLNYFNGKTGIGTTAPATALDVHGTLRIAYGGESCTASTVGGLYFSSVTHQLYGCLTAGSWTPISTGATAGAAAGSNTQVQFNSGGSLGADTGLVWDNAHKHLGINTAAPSAAGLVVNAAGGGNTYALFNVGGHGVSIVGDQASLGLNTYFDSGRGGWRSIGNGYSAMLGVDHTTGAFYIYTTPSAAPAPDTLIQSALTRNFVMQGDGRVGIATVPTASSRLTIGDKGGGISEIVTLINSQAAAAGNGVGVVYQGPASIKMGSVGAIWEDGGNNAGLYFNTRNSAYTTKMYLSAAGMLGIGTTGAPATKLDVNGTIRMGYGGESCSASTLGSLYFSSAAHQLYGCLTAPNWTAISTAAGAGAAAGADTQVQFNSGGSLGASAGLTFAPATGVLTSARRIVAGGSGHDSGSVFITGGNGSSTGPQNTAVGAGALTANTTGNSNVALGFNALQANTTGDSNTALGASALQSDTTGFNNTAIGPGALFRTTTGANNIAVGPSAGFTLTTGIQNILIGESANTPAANTSNFLNIGSTIFATGTNIGTVTAPAGKVGIGTTAPAVALDVSGTLRIAYGGESCSASTVGGLYYSSATHQIYGCLTAGSWTQLATGTPPASGSNSQVQFNSGGLFGADSNFVWDNANKRLGLGTAAPTTTLDVAGQITVTDPGQPYLLNITGGCYNCGQSVANITNNGSGNTATLALSNTSSGLGTVLRAGEYGANNFGYAVVATNNSPNGWGIYSSGTSPNYFKGRVGIDTTTPHTALDVNGEIRPGDTGVACSGTTEGAIRYNSASHAPEYCNGTAWTGFPMAAVACAAPSGLTFTDLTTQPLNTVVTSAPATITFTGCAGFYSVNVTGAATAQISINGGPWATSGAIASGQTLQVRMTTSGSVSTTLTATVTVGSATTNWSTTTRSGALKVFMTPTGYVGGNIGSLANADSFCQAAANAAGLAGTYKAILSDDTTSAASRLVLSYPIVNAYNGSTVAATNLWIGSISTAILTPTGGYSTTGWISTGTNPDGSIATGHTCSSWTSTAATTAAGYTGSINAGWINANSSFSCSSPNNLYCVQQ